MPLVRIILSVVALSMSLAAQAQVYPAKPVRLIVPYPAGGGAEAVAKSAPDGYTLLLGDTATFAVNPSLYKNCPMTRSRISRRSP